MNSEYLILLKTKKDLEKELAFFTAQYVNASAASAGDIKSQIANIRRKLKNINEELETYKKEFTEPILVDSISENEKNELVIAPKSKTPQHIEQHPLVAPISQPNDSPTNKIITIKNTVIIALSVAFLFIFFALAKPGSEVDFLGWFKAKQGMDNADKLPVLISRNVTVLGGVDFIEEGKPTDYTVLVSVKDDYGGIRQQLQNGNSFTLRDVPVKQDSLIAFEFDFIQLKRKIYSESINLPTPDSRGICKIGRITIVTPKGYRSNQDAFPPKVIIKFAPNIQVKMAIGDNNHQ